MPPALLTAADCNRLRVMADGNLKVCLFGANEVSLRWGWELTWQVHEYVLFFECCKHCAREADACPRDACQSGCAWAAQSSTLLRAQHFGNCAILNFISTQGLTFRRLAYCPATGAGLASVPETQLLCPHPSQLKGRHARGRL